VTSTARAADAPQPRRRRPPTRMRLPLCNEGHLVRKASRMDLHGLLALSKCKFRRALTPDGELRSPSARRKVPDCAGLFSCGPAATASSPDAPATRVQVHQARRGAERGEAHREKCPQCGEGSSWSGPADRPFVACSRYPNASTAPTSARTAKLREGPKVLTNRAPSAQAARRRRGRYGMFKSCSDYPKCRAEGVKKVEPPRNVPAARSARKCSVVSR